MNIRYEHMILTYDIRSQTYTESVGLIAALATIAVTTAGFLRKCCPNDVFGAIKFDDAVFWLLLLFVDALLRDASE